MALIWTIVLNECVQKVVETTQGAHVMALFAFIAAIAAVVFFFIGRNQEQENNNKNEYLTKIGHQQKYENWKEKQH